MKRREVIKGLAILPLSGIVGSATAEAAPAVPQDKGATPAFKSVYAQLGVKPLINARGTVTVVGASQVLPEVQKAMDAAVREYVQIDELMDGVGARLAELTGAEYGCITSGASAAVTAGTAGCVTGGDPDKIWMIPNVTGMKDEVIIPAYSRSAYDAGAKAVGVRMVEVSTLEELKLAVGPRTAMILVLAGSQSETGSLSIAEISRVVKPVGVPILVDAAAEGLEVPNPHLMQGADLVAYSGGKYLRGPQCAGLLLGRKDLILAARMNTGPHHGFGRGYKVGREEIMGMLTAVEMWFKRDHATEWKTWVSWGNTIARRLDKIPGVTTTLLEPKARSNRAPSLTVSWDSTLIPLTGEDVESLLWNGTPRIAVSGAGSFLPFPPNLKPEISIATTALQAGEEKVIAERVFAILSNPPAIKRAAGAPSANISGGWDLTMKFPGSTVLQTWFIEQRDSALSGMHVASVGARALKGTLHGNTVLLRSSYTKEGVRINYAFTGVVDGDTMHGEVSLSEYGNCEWTASRHG
jgi:D-glucosaminate-6-phosphate ammonia-lyase